MKKLKDISHTISFYCKEQPAIMAAYIFGSFAKNRAGKSSDIDVAVLLDETQSQSFSILSFISVLEKSLKCRVDVVVLNRAGEVLKYEVRRSGILVFERSSDIRKKFEIKGQKTYEDFLYLHNRYVRTVLYGRKNG